MGSRGQTGTRLDGYGYCKKYDCFDRSGRRAVLDGLVEKARAVQYMPDETGIVSGPVSNTYSKRHRYANAVIHEASREFGGCPLAVLKVIPDKYHGPWDRNIRW